MTAPYRIRRPDVRAREVAGGGEADFKFYLDRLLKMIPGEVVALYLVGSGLIPYGQSAALIIWALVCLAGVVLLRAYGTTEPAERKPPDWIHVAISCVAFIIWVYSLGGPFAAMGLSVPWVGSLLVLAWTFFVPIFYKGPAD